MVHGRPLLPGILAQTDAPPSKSPIFNRYSIARSSLAVTPSEKVQLTRIGSPLRAFR